MRRRVAAVCVSILSACARTPPPAAIAAPALPVPVAGDAGASASPPAPPAPSWGRVAELFRGCRAYPRRDDGSRVIDCDDRRIEVLDADAHSAQRAREEFLATVGDGSATREPVSLRTAGPDVDALRFTSGRAAGYAVIATTPGGQARFVGCSADLRPSNRAQCVDFVQHFVRYLPPAPAFDPGPPYCLRHRAGMPELDVALAAFSYRRVGADCFGAFDTLAVASATLDRLMTEVAGLTGLAPASLRTASPLPDNGPVFLGAPTQLALGYGPGLETTASVEIQRAAARDAVGLAHLYPGPSQLRELILLDARAGRAMDLEVVSFAFAFDTLIFTREELIFNGDESGGGQNRKDLGEPVARKVGIRPEELRRSAHGDTYGNLFGLTTFAFDLPTLVERDLHAAGGFRLAALGDAIVGWRSEHDVGRGVPGRFDWERGTWTPLQGEPRRTAQAALVALNSIEQKPLEVGLGQPVVSTRDGSLAILRVGPGLLAQAARLERP